MPPHKWKRSYTVLLLLVSSTAFSQVYFTKVEADKYNSQILISYNLLLKGKSYDKYKTQIYYSVDKGKTFSDNPLQYVSGDIGNGISPGFGKKIVWNFFIENPDLTGKGLVFKIKVEKDVLAEEERILALGGSEKAFRSVLVPGWGDAKVRSGKRYWIITAATLGTLGTGIFFGTKSQNNYNKYLSAGSSQDANNFYSNYKSDRQISTILVTAGVTAWITDVIVAVIRGNKNKKAQSEILKLREQESKNK